MPHKNAQTRENLQTKLDAESETGWCPLIGMLDAGSYT